MQINSESDYAELESQVARRINLIVETVRRLMDSGMETDQIEEAIEPHTQYLGDAWTALKAYRDGHDAG